MPESRYLQGFQAVTEHMLLQNCGSLRKPQRNLWNIFWITQKTSYSDKLFLQKAVDILDIRDIT